MVDINDIPDFVGSPGQTPTPGTGPDTTPVAVVLVTCPLDADGLYTPVNQAAVDTFITGEVAGSRAYSTTVARWSPWSVLQLPLTLGAARGYNYARFTLPDGSKWYGYLSADYLNVTDTLFTVTPDDCATYPYTVGYSTWKFGHVAIAASQGDTYGNEYLDAPEPVDVSPEYGQLLADLTNSDMTTMKAIVVSTNALETTPFQTTSNQALLQYGQDVLTVVSGEPNPIIDELGIPGSIPHTPTYWWVDGTQFYVPRVFPTDGGKIDGVPQGGGVYVFTMEGLRRYLSIGAYAPWILEGIAQIHFVPDWAVDGGATSSGGFYPVGQVMSPTDTVWTELSLLGTTARNDDLTIKTKAETLLGGWRDTVLATYGATMYRKLITSAGGTSVVLSTGDTETEFKPEAWLESGLSVEQIPDSVYGGVKIIPTGFGGLLGGELGVTLDFSGTITPGLSGRSLAHQYGQATQQSKPYHFRKSLELNILNAQWSRTFGASVAAFSSELGVLTGAVQGVIGGAAIGGPVGAAAGGVAGVANGAMNAAVNMQVAGLSLTNGIFMAMLQADNTLKQSMPMSSWSDYDDTLAMSGKGGGANVDGAWQMKAGRGGRLIIKVPTKGKIRTLLSQWDRHGYAIDRAFVPPRLDPMTHRSYWQGENVVILGAVPADAKSRIAARFERGTTVVSTVSEVGAQTANAANSGVSY